MWLLWGGYGIFGCNRLLMWLLRCSEQLQSACLGVAMVLQGVSYYLPCLLHGSCCGICGCNGFTYVVARMFRMVVRCMLGCPRLLLWHYRVVARVLEVDDNVIY